MDLENSIRKYVDKKGLKIDFVYSSIGMTASGFYKMLKSNSIKVDTLEKIAACLTVPVSYFFATEKEQDEILNGKEDDFWNGFERAFKSVSGLALAMVAMTDFHKITEKIAEDSNYSKDNIQADLLIIEEKLINLFRIFDQIQESDLPTKIFTDDW